MVLFCAFLMVLYVSVHFYLFLYVSTSFSTILCVSHVFISIHFYIFLYVSTCFYIFPCVSNISTHFYMFTVCFQHVPIWFYVFLHLCVSNMFLYVSICFLYVSNMFLYVSTRFCKFLYVSTCFYIFPVAPPFVLGSNPKSQGCFPLISDGHWGWERAASSACAAPFSVLPTAPTPKTHLPPWGQESIKGGDPAERETFWGCDAEHVWGRLGKFQSWCPCAEDLLCVWWDQGFHPTTGMHSSAFLESLESPHSSRAASSPLWRKFPGWVWVF